MTQTSVPANIVEKLKKALTQGEKDAAVQITQEALSQGVAPLALVQEVVIPALTEVGKLFENLDIFLPELMAAGEAGNARQRVEFRARRGEGGTAPGRPKSRPNCVTGT